MNIILGIITAFLNSITDSIWKKAVVYSKLPQSLFSFFGPIWGIIFIYIIIAINGVNTKIFFDIETIFLILLIAIISYLITFLYINVYKKVKLSELLPYKNLDKIFIVLFGFFIFYGTKNSTSFTSFIITLITIFIIIAFSIDFKNKIKLSKDILIFIFIKFLESITTLLVGYIFLQYTTVDYLSIETLFFISLTLIIAIFEGHNLKLIFTQDKKFYKYRLGAGFIGWIAFIIGLYIVETSGVLIATLLSFIGLIFQILSIKFILKDNPEKKQIILAFIVMFMIGIGYYFK